MVYIKKKLTRNADLPTRPTPFLAFLPSPQKRASLHEAILHSIPFLGRVTQLPNPIEERAKETAFPSHRASARLIRSGQILPVPVPVVAPRMAEGDAPAAAAAAAASPRSPMPPETPATQKRRQRGLVSRVWKGIFGGREDVEKLLQALSKEEEAVRARLRRRARASRQSAHNVLALAAALEVIRLVPAGLPDYT